MYLSIDLLFPQKLSKGITVVHSKPVQNTSSDKATELQKLDNLPRVGHMISATPPFHQCWGCDHVMICLLSCDMRCFCVLVLFSCNTSYWGYIAGMRSVEIL